jgi:hypothetical protein
MTLLLPVLLDKVPDFYAPGQFDDELERLSQAADEGALQELNARRTALPQQAPTVEAAAKPIPAPAAGDCAPNVVAKTWLSELDAAIARRDAPAIVNKFAPEVSVLVTVPGADGKPTAVQMGRAELARSTTAAVGGLMDYQQRRPFIEGRAADEGGSLCERIGVRSLVIEQGRQNGKPYRFESVEEYVLERRAGQWLAIRAATTQR